MGFMDLVRLIIAIIVLQQQLKTVTSCNCNLMVITTDMQINIIPVAN